MDDAFKIVTFDVDGLLRDKENESNCCDDWAIEKRFDSHESLAYGVDWSFDSTADEHGVQEVETLIASCSFYDRALHLWSG